MNFIIVAQKKIILRIHNICLQYLHIRFKLYILKSISLFYYTAIKFWSSSLLFQLLHVRCRRRRCVTTTQNFMSTFSGVTWFAIFKLMLGRHRMLSMFIYHSDSLLVALSSFQFCISGAFFTLHYVLYMFADGILL